jgi:hypothetical protein
MSSIALNHTSPVAEAPAGAGFFARIRRGYRALGEGLVAYHRYERLRARGFSHEEAARRSFDLDYRV